VEGAVVADVHHTLAELVSVGMCQIGDEDEPYMWANIVSESSTLGFYFFLYQTTQGLI
jgi:hypothetical protein